MSKMSFSFSLNVILSMSKIDQIHLRAVMLCMSKMSKMGREHTHTFLYRVCDMLKVFEMSFSFFMNVMLSMLKMSKIGQIRLRAVMLCMSKMSKIGREHTYTFLLITFLIFNGFSIRKKFWKAETQELFILSILKHVKNVEDRSSSLKGCNAMYVGDVEDGKRTYPHICAHNFLNI